MMGVRMTWQSDCVSGTLYTFSLYQMNTFVPTVLTDSNRDVDCSETVCPGDLWVTNQPLYYDKGGVMGLGNVYMSCVGSNTANESFCEVTFEVKDHEDSFHGHGIFSFANESVFTLISGNGYWDRTIGAARATPKRWDIGMCFASESCNGGELMYFETTVNMTLLAGYEGAPNGPNALYVLSNNISSVKYPDSPLGSDEARCIALTPELWSCLWDVRVPDEQNKVFMQGLWSTQDYKSYVSVIGGVGKYASAKGDADIYPTNSSVPQGWTFDIEMVFGCQAKDPNNYYYLDINRTDVQIYPFPSSMPYNRKLRQSVLGSGAISLWEGTGIQYNFSLGNATFSNWSFVVVDSTLSVQGKCILQNDLVTNLCDWVFSYTDLDKLTVSGRVLETEVTSLAVTGGSGALVGARGPASFDPAVGWSLAFTTSPDIPIFVAAAPRLCYVAALCYFLVMTWLFY